MACALQAAARGMLARSARRTAVRAQGEAARTAAATRMQAVCRGHRVRFEERRVRDALHGLAAIAIQQYVRRYLVVRMAAKLRTEAAAEGERTFAANLLQRAWLAAVQRREGQRLDDEQRAQEEKLQRWRLALAQEADEENAAAVAALQEVSSRPTP